MYANQTKCLITIVKDFQKEFEDELTVKNGDVVQFSQKLDRYWFEVYHNGQTGKVPISSCREWNQTEMSSIRLVKPDQAAFVAKYDFCNDCVEGDLRFSASEIILGFEAMNDDWWYGARLSSIKNSITSLSVKEDQCGIFPLTHVWRLRDDLLPDSVFAQTGVSIESANATGHNETTTNLEVATNNHDTHHHHSETISSDCFYVKVIKTMTAHLSEEMDLPEIGEILRVNSIPDKLYFMGQSLDGTKSGMFPQNFVTRLEDNYEPTDLNSTNSSTSSPIPSSNPPTIPPPSPPHITINFGKHLSVDFADSLGQNPNRTPLDTPPSYEAAISCEPVSYGYANHMFSGVESYGRVLFDFDAQENFNELTLRENQIVRLYRHVDDSWMEGEIDGKVGLFPTSYIQIIVDCEPDAAATSDPNGEHGNQNHAATANQVVAINYPPNTKARILYDFDPEMEQDLKVRTGDIVTLLQRFTSTDWVEAMDSAGNVGFIHLNFCELLGSDVPEPTLPEISHSNHYANTDNNAHKSGVPLKKGDKIGAESSTKNTTSGSSFVNTESSSSTKPHRPAPPAPRRTNVFPTFNQFLFNDKQEILQYEIEQELASTPAAAGTSNNNNLSQPVQKEAPTPESANKNKRQCVITELIQTERDYCHAMNVCLTVFRNNGAEAQRCNVDIEKLFGAMKAVVNVSKSLIKLLDNYANNRPYIDQRVGICFLDLKFEIKEAYTKYCRNHDSTNMLLRFYEADSKSSEFMRRCQSSIQDQTNCFDISSIVIKPIQRILKYPLLINELIKCTEESHIDWDPLLMTLQMITDIATSINEHKRRHDLIQKYCKKNNDTSFSGRLKNLNKHTVMKKSSRLANRFISTLTFSSVHKDETYDAALNKFTSMDKSIKSFVKSIKDYVHNLGEYYMQSLVVANSILEYYGPKREAEELKSTHHEIYSKYFADFRFCVERDVINTLQKLEEKFKAPWILINKRKDKLVDYDASLKSKNDCSLAKNDFEALNQQLIEELPLLTDLSLQVFSNCLQTLMSANKVLICRTARIFLNLHQLPFIINSPFGYFQDIEEVFRVKHNVIFSQMLQDFSLIHASAFNGPLADATSAATSTLSRLHIHRSSNTWKNSLPARKSPQIGASENEKKVQDSGQKRNLESRYKPEDLYVVTQTYNPQDVFDLYAQAEDLIGVIKRKDPSGQEHRWYVDRGETKGFLPKYILAPYRKGLLQTQQSIESCSSLVSSHSSDRSTPLPAYENIDLLTEQHRYDTVPEEDLTGVLDPHTSLLSFDDIDHPANFETKNSLLEFDPLASTSTTTQFNTPGSSKGQPKLDKSSSSSSGSNSQHSPAAPLSLLDNVYYAAYNFKAGDQNQLSMQVGQRVLVKQRCDLQNNKEWWLVAVVNSSGQEVSSGYVPANYLRKN